MYNYPNILGDKKLVLSSSSPRRKQLLSEAGIPFDVRVKFVEEIFPESMPANEVAAYLAEKKARVHTDSISDDEIILTADTVVIFRDAILGKPLNADEALSMLMQLSGNRHTVITGVCLMSKTKTNIFSVVTDVKFYSIDPAEAMAYITLDKPFDKAGAYGIQEWIGKTKVKYIRGSYTNVMGLPMAALYQALLSF